jgi:hypothetical protein
MPFRGIQTSPFSGFLQIAVMYPVLHGSFD